eukprot:3141765-Prymnesium_polylepis.1
MAGASSSAVLSSSNNVCTCSALFSGVIITRSCVGPDTQPSDHSLTFPNPATWLTVWTFFGSTNSSSQYCSRPYCSPANVSALLIGIFNLNSWAKSCSRNANARTAKGMVAQEDEGAWPIDLAQWTCVRTRGREQPGCGVRLRGSRRPLSACSESTGKSIWPTLLLCVASHFSDLQSTGRIRNLFAVFHSVGSVSLSQSTWKNSLRPCWSLLSSSSFQ